MSNEITVNSMLSVTKVDSAGRVVQQHQTRPGQFTADMIGLGGGGPGGFTASIYGTEVDVSEVDTPGMCEVSNHDSTNYVILGIYDPQTDVFYPMDEIGPGEQYVKKLWRGLLQEFTGTGTGTTGPTNQLMIKANTAACKVSVRIFER